MSNSEGFYLKTKKGIVAHVLADRNIPPSTLNALEAMIDIAYHKKGLGSLNKTRLNKMEQTFGQKAVGLSFNPSNDDKVGKAKRLCADLADLVNDNDAGDSQTYLYNLIKGSALREILNAQMNVVKLLTLKY